VKRAWPRAHDGLSAGKPTVSTDQFTTPSGAAACVARLPAGGRVGVEWGDSSHRLVRRKVAQTKTWRHWAMCTAGMAASTRRFELGETHGEHRPVRHAERRHGVCCCTGSHARSAWYLHRWGYSSPSGPGGWRPPPGLGTVASWCLVSRRPSARALSCRAASHWRRSSCGSSARSRCTGSHARSAWYLHRWGYSTPSGPGAGARLPSSAPSRHGV